MGEKDTIDRTEAEGAAQERMRTEAIAPPPTNRPTSEAEAIEMIVGKVLERLNADSMPASLYKRVGNLERTVSDLVAGSGKRKAG